MNTKFVKMPSGMIVNLERISFIGRVNAIKEYQAKKAKEWTLTIQFINEERPTILSYSVEDEARNDYEALVKACEV